MVHEDIFRTAKSISYESLCIPKLTLYTIISDFYLHVLAFLEDLLALLVGEGVEDHEQVALAKVIAA